MRLWMLVLFSAMPLFADARITVSVIHAKTRAPLDGVALIFQKSVEEAPATSTTDAFGRAEVQLKPGSYVLWANRTDFGSIRYMPIFDLWVNAIVVRDDEPQTITFPVFVPARIRGVVRDELGNPLASACVQRSGPRWIEGRIGFGFGGCTLADEEGRYTLDVEPGNYVLCALPNSGQIKPVPVMGEYDFSAPPPTRVYRRTCFPTIQPDASRTIHVEAGDLISYDLVVQSVPGGNIRGRLSEPLRTSIILRDRTRGGQDSQSVSNEFGEFQFHGIPVGEYRLELQAGLSIGEAYKDRYASLDLNFTGADISDLELVLERRPTVNLAFDEESPGIAKGVRYVSLANGHGDFFELLPPRPFDERKSGNWWLRHGTSDKVCITDARLDGKPVFRQAIPLANGGTSELVLRVSEHCAGPAEVRTMSNGNPVALARVVFLLSGTPETPGHIFTAATDAEAKFTLKGVAAGRYLAWAWLDKSLLEGDPNAYVGPPDLASVAELATVLDLTEENAVNVEIPILNSPRP